MAALSHRTANEGSAAGPSAAAPPPAAPPAQQRASRPASISRAGSTRLGPSLAGSTRPGPNRVGPAVDAPHHPPLLVPGAQLLPKGWRKTLPEEQQEWLGRALFTCGTGKKPVLTGELHFWWSPPGARELYTQIPSAQAFFQCRFFLWAPYKIWAYKLSCPSCKRQLTGAGLYRTVRRVLDIDNFYFMGTEHLACRACKKKYAAWAQEILSQLDLAHQARFPAVLTKKLSCDKRVVGMMQPRTMGNSPSRLRAALVEQHTRKWLEKIMRYLSVLELLQVPGVPPQQVTVPPLRPVPNVPWLISVYVMEAFSRLEETKARMTKKLAGHAAGTAACVSNVGNEHGQVLMSVLSESEGDGLWPMAAGLVRRYRAAGKAPPRVLYVDRDCCSIVGRCTTAEMFGEWDQLVVRLDILHLMRRFARGVTTDSHLLYGVFMSRLSFAIFEWDGGDFTRLQEARQSRLDPTSRELARHCRRRTRGVEETERLIQELLDTMWDATDIMGVPLIDHPEMEEIWSTQRCHLQCIQDPPGVALYTKTGEVTRGGVVLPVYRCARGSTSLESFHLHLCQFIPGTSANDLHFQVYLLEGLVRWNEDRARAAVAGNARRSTARCYNARLLSSVNRLSKKFMGITLVENFTQPWEYTGELIGLEYLYSQTGGGALRIGSRA
ncbi:unnamed protein product [Pleuronectes platessa]|uniref:DUF6729 domain-containing protein n=1 Tax=Pleuronectes platessa TaxID=8262 RepID=A0A9N7YVA9_PLEPL|nr:unnamed protein product [Pleuronectes platessa]